MSDSLKFQLLDYVRCTNSNLLAFDQVGRIVGRVVNSVAPYKVEFGGGKVQRLKEHELTLADPDVHTVLDQMDAESAPDTRGMVDGDAKSEGAPERTGITAEDKLRLIADTVERQPPFGTELANFRRRLSAILSIDHDA